MMNIICQTLLEDTHWKENNSYKLNHDMNCFICIDFFVNYFFLHTFRWTYGYFLPHKKMSQLEGELPIRREKFPFESNTNTRALNNCLASMREMCKSTTMIDLQIIQQCKTASQSQRRSTPLALNG